MNEPTSIKESRDSADVGPEPFALSDLHYHLPEELIARTPAPRRDAARMLRVDRETDALSHHTVADLPNLLEPGDLLVLNNTRVIPARFTARRATGGIVRGLFLDEPQKGVWHVMLEGSRRLRVPEQLTAGSKDLVRMELAERRDEGHWLVRIDGDEPAAHILDRIGETPLPPYIGRKSDQPDPDSTDRDRYQTVYATNPGAVAAPTAGLHFTQELLSTIQQRGIETTFLTLHVGLGTFKPITANRLADHRMHREWFDLPKSATDAINACRARGGRIVAVGTTSVRVLETAAQDHAASISAPAASTPSPLLEPCCGWTDMFIYPPYRFAVVDALLTNFHLPRSTLLALVMAFAGTSLTRRSYEHAIADRYRFYSYGDAMLIV
jgi:S-adenosylmethionine:tRNA ribosyltransferase-isomerase